MPKSRKILFQLLTAVLLFVLQGCNKKGLFISGERKTELRTFESFSEIELYDKISLVLIQDSIHGISVEAGANLIADVETKISNGRLEIRDNSKFKWTRDLDYSITVYVHTDLLKRITYHGAGNISSTNILLADKFTMDSFNGIGNIDLALECREAELIIRMANADFRLRGKSDYTVMYCADYGSMNLSAFESKDLHMDYRSIRDSKINVTGLLSGSIHYNG
ncbi:MAG: hypothetical protein EOO02_12120, partial [Chitinophagaceae bacterium]